MTFPAQTAKALATKSGKPVNDPKKENVGAAESPIDLKPGEKKAWADMIED
jgi:hypothetical protein